MTNIDPNTGLPELPDGYFWRVRMDSIGYHDLELRQRRWIGSNRLASRGIFVVARRTPQEAILVAARELMSQRAGSASLIQFEGDYPPKKLEANDANA